MASQSSEANTPTVGIVLPPVWTQVFLTQARLLEATLGDLGFAAEVVEYDGRLRHDSHVVLGWSLFEKPFPSGSHYVLIQLEPLCLPFWRQRLEQKRFLFNHAAAVWDYSLTNLPFLGGWQARWVPLGYHPQLQEVELKTEFHEYDALFVGFLSPRRQAILEQLANRCSLSMQPRWRGDFRQALANSKILVNIHQHDVPVPLEQPRVAYALNQRSFVVTEHADDEPYPWLMSVAFDELIQRVLYYLYHPLGREAARQESFAAFRSLTMIERVRPYLRDLMLAP